MLKILIDMNLSPMWADILSAQGCHAVHWSEVGASNATDATVMAWALDNNFIVLTHDLDFGTMLALTHATGPSVVQVRTQNIYPDPSFTLLSNALRQHEQELERGALLVIDPIRARVRLLPLT